MIRHILLIDWVENATADTISEAIEAVEQMRALPWIQKLEYGQALGLVDDSWDFAVMMEFANDADWEGYDADPRHEASAVKLRPHIARKARIQYRCEA
jgi:hypothetical protein